jgi:YggT family protein
VAAFLRNLIELSLLAVWLLVLGRVLLSWIDPANRSALGGFLYQATEPLLAPIRRVLPSTGMIDLSPLILLVVLGVVTRAFL